MRWHVQIHRHAPWGRRRPGYAVDGLSSTGQPGRSLGAWPGSRRGGCDDEERGKRTGSKGRNEIRMVKMTPNRLMLVKANVRWLLNERCGEV